MIPGDIDLTRNLDFRKTKRNEIKQLPDSWKGNGINKKTYNYIDIDNIGINNNISITTSSVTYTTNISIDDNSTYYINTNNGTNYAYETNNSANYVYNSYFITMRSNDDLYITDAHNNIINSKCYVTVNYKPEYDVFGNQIIPEQQIESIPWKTYQEPKIKNIAWDMSLKRKMGDYLFIEDDIPWEETDNYIWYDLGFDQSNKFSISKAAEFISYLKGKSSSFIERYLNRDIEDNSSYLIDMNWIRVRDAII